MAAELTKRQKKAAKFRSKQRDGDQPAEQNYTEPIPADASEDAVRHEDTGASAPPASDAAASEAEQLKLADGSAEPTLQESKKPGNKKKSKVAATRTVFDENGVAHEEPVELETREKPGHKYIVFVGTYAYF